MTFTVHSIFKTIQGEGYWAGSTAVFCRFAGCNLWSGREQDRADGCSAWCDTDFVGGSKFGHDNLVAAIQNCWGEEIRSRRVVFTGGEPGLQLDGKLIEALNMRLFASHVETNGTVELPDHLRWVTLSPKANTELKQLDCNELKVAWPQDLDLEQLHRRINPTAAFLQPIDGPRLKENTAVAVAYVKAHPWWRISIQTQKVMGIP
jgi:7-carboxy-7-deazaguanine synthase (Cx14CxxC type)